MSEYLKPLLSDVMLAGLTWIGLLLIWIGSLIWGTADTRGGIDAGIGIKSFGMLLVTWALVIGGMLRHDLDQKVRLAMIVAGTLLIIFVGYWSSGMWLGMPF